MTERKDWRDLPPVEENIERPEKASQSLLARMDVCPRSAYLYMKHGGGVESHALARGSCFHHFAERATQLCQEQGEISMPGEVAKDLMIAVIREHPELTIPESEQEALRVMAWHWGEGVALNLPAIAGTEIMVELEVGEWIVRGKIDLLMIDGAELWVKDFKTSLNIATQEEVERDFQTKFYALLAMEGHAEGDPMRLGAGVDLAHVAIVYPRYTREEDGTLVERSTSYTRPELADFRATVESHLEKLDHALDTGLWPAVPGPQCSTCPAATECPIPEHLRPVDEIRTLADAEDEATAWEFNTRAERRRKASLKKFHERSGAPIVFGDFMLDTQRTEKSVSIDRDKLRADIEALANEGREFDLDAYFRKVPASNFTKVKRPQEEQDG